MEKVIKTVIAIETCVHNGITRGKEYDVHGEDDNFYDIVNDIGNNAGVFKSRFESKELSNAKRIADEVTALAERERVRDFVVERVRNSCLPGGDIFNAARGFVGSGWKIHKAGMAICSNDYEPNEYVKVLDQLRDVMRVPEGENIVTHAKVLRALADALICLQK